MPATYSGIGITLLYPESWQTQEAGEMDAPGIVLESPGGAFFSVHRYEGVVEPEALLARSLAAMREDYPELEESSWERPGGAGRELDFYCLDLVITSRIWVIPSDDGCLLVQMQAESREFDRQEAVFEAMLHSLEQSLEDDDATG